MTELKITSQPISADAGLMKVSGAVDEGAFEQLEDELNRLVESGVRQVAVDFSNLEWISSAGLGAFVNLAVILRERGGKIMIAGLRPEISELIDMLGVRDALGAVDRMDAVKREFFSLG